MKIVFILPGTGISGGVKVTCVAANYLLDRGHDVRILFKKNPTNIRNMFRFISHSVLYRKNHDWIQIFKGKANSFRDINKCNFDIKEIIIGVGLWVINELIGLKALPNPILHYVHGWAPWNLDAVKNAFSQPFPKVVVASYLKPKVESFGGGKVLKIINNGFDQNEYFNVSDESERDGVGTIYARHPAKDPETILSVLKIIKKEQPNVPIRTFGMERKRGLIIELSCYDRYPSIERAREIYSKSKVWFLASKAEGFPAPVFEAMSCGCAVVTTDCGGVSDIITNGKNGFIVEVGNVPQIVKKISLLLDNDGLRKRICLEAKQTVEKFTWEKSVDKLENVLKKLVLSHDERIDKIS